MRAPAKLASKESEWKPTSDPEGRFSTGIADFDQLLGGGFQRGSVALIGVDETVEQDDLDLLLLPTFLNFLYQSRGIVAILPSRDSPHKFRARLTRYVTRRRFDSRVRVVDYAGEDEGHSYVVNMKVKDAPPGPSAYPPSPKEREVAIAKMVKAEKAATGNRGKPILELVACEVFETLMGPEEAAKMFFHGAKRTRQVGNLGILPMATGLGMAAAARRLADTEFALHHDEVGLLIRGVRPSFPNHVVVADSMAGPPHVSFVPRPA